MLPCAPFAGLPRSPALPLLTLTPALAPHTLRPCSVRWHMATVGSETDMHNLHLHGNTFLK